MRLCRCWGFRTRPQKRRVSLFWLLPYSLRLTKLTVLIFFLIQEGFYGPNTAPQPHRKQPSSARKKSSTSDQKRNAGRLSGNTVVPNSSASSSSKKSRMTPTNLQPKVRSQGHLRTARSHNTLHTTRSQGNSLVTGSQPLTAQSQGFLRPVRSQDRGGTMGRPSKPAA